MSRTRPQRPEGELRQSDYPDALQARRQLVRIKDGRSQEKNGRCRDRGSTGPVFEEKETDVNIAFPPKRHSADLRRVVHGFMFIGDDKIRRAQLPDEWSPGGCRVAAAQALGLNVTRWSVS